MSLAVDVPPELVEAIAERTAELVSGGLADRERVGEGLPRERLALSKSEAAEAIGVSVDHLERHVLPELRTVRSGRLRLIPVVELDAWLGESASRALGDHG